MAEVGEVLDRVPASVEKGGCEVELGSAVDVFDEPQGDGPVIFARANRVKRTTVRTPSGPKIAQAEGDRIERTDAHGVVVLRARNQQPLPASQLERLEGAIDWVDEPQVGHSFAGIDRALSVQVDLAGRVRKHLAHPVGREGEVRGAGQLRLALAAPAREVRHQNVFFEMELRLVEDPPSSRTASTELEGVAEIVTER